MLTELKHPKGSDSPKFNALIGICAAQNILRTKEVLWLFAKVHSLRTGRLHRMEREIPASETAAIAQNIYSTFEWIDDYTHVESCSSGLRR